MNQINIIIPCYYTDTILEKCLLSLSQQTKKNNIIIYLINDCSPNTKDKYSKLIKKYSNNLDITYLETLKNSGPGVARQLGLNNLPNNAEYVMFIDDDDQLADSKTIENFLNIIENRDKNSIIGFINDYRYYEQNHFDNNNSHFTGSIFNFKLIQIFNLQFNNDLSYLEEDTDFLLKYFFYLNKMNYYFNNIIIYNNNSNNGYTYIKTINKNSLTETTKLIDFYWGTFKLYNSLCLFFLNQENENYLNSIIKQEINNLYIGITSYSFYLKEYINQNNFNLFKITNLNLLKLLYKYKIKIEIQDLVIQSDLTLLKKYSLEEYCQMLDEEFQKGKQNYDIDSYT